MTPTPKRRDYTSGPVLPSLLALAVPIVLANVLQTVYQLTDTFWLGRLGAGAVAAVSLSFPVIFLIISLGAGLAVAGAVLIAQAYGAGDARAVDHVAAQTLASVATAAVLLSVLGYFASEPLMRVMGAGPAVIADATLYMKVSFVGLVFLYVYFVFQSLLRGVGDVKTPFYIVLGTVLLNFLFDPLFILGLWGAPRMGVAGAALATVGTQGLAAVVGVGFLFSGRFGIHLHARDLVPDLRLVRRIVRLGVPASVEQSTRALGLSVMTALVAGFGTPAVAAYGIGTRIFSFVLIPALGLSMATSTLVGQNIGAGKPERAGHVAAVSAKVAFVGLTAVGVLFFVFARALTDAFIPTDPAVAAGGARFLRIMALTFGFLGVQQVLGGAFRGAGNTVAAMALAIVTLWVLRFPLAWFLAERTTLGEAGIWWAFPVSNVIAAVAAWLWLRRDTWKGQPLTGEHELEEEVARETIVEEGLG